MGVIATFDYAKWIALFPELAGVVEPAADAYFAVATTIHANDGGGPVATLAQQAALLNYLTAHIARLFSDRDESGLSVSGGSVPAPDTVGRVSQATEGSVSVTLDMGQVTNQQAWFLQTKYGSLYWQATAAYRTARYRVALRGKGVVYPWGPLNPGI